MKEAKKSELDLLRVSNIPFHVSIAPFPDGFAPPIMGSGYDKDKDKE